MKSVLSFYSILLPGYFCLIACSVGGISQPIPGVGDPTESPVAPIAEFPIDTTSPILISEPLPITGPETTPSVPINSEPALEPIAVIEETPTTPEVLIVEPSTAVNVVSPEANPESEYQPPTSVPESLPSLRENQDELVPPVLTASPTLETPIPEPILNIVENLPLPTQGEANSTPPISNNVINEVIDTTTPPGTPEIELENSPSVDPSFDTEEEIVVSGSCHGKKRVGIVITDSRQLNKTKDKAVHCRNDQFVLKFIEKKKDQPHLKIQTVYFD